MYVCLSKVFGEDGIAHARVRGRCLQHKANRLRVVSRAYSPTSGMFVIDHPTVCTVCSQPNSGVWRRHCPTLSGRRLSAHDDAPEIDYFKPPCTRPPTPTGSTSCTDSLGTDRAAKCSRFSDFSGRLFESERRPRVCVCVCVRDFVLSSLTERMKMPCSFICFTAAVWRRVCRCIQAAEQGRKSPPEATTVFIDLYCGVAVLFDRLFNEIWREELGCWGLLQHCTQRNTRPHGLPTKRE